MKSSNKTQPVGSRPEKPSTKNPAPKIDQPTSGADPMADHPIAELFPLMSESDLDELAKDIKLNGQRETITTYEGKLLDGRNRFRACLKARVKPETIEFSGGDPVDFVVSKNINRRHLTTGQRSMIAGELANLKQGDVAAQKDAVSNETPLSLDKAAKVMRVSRAHAARAQRVIKNGNPDIIKAVKHGDLSVGQAERMIRDQQTPESAENEDTPSRAAEGTSSGETALDPEPDIAEVAPGNVPASVGPESAKRAIKELKNIPKTDPGREDAFRMVLAFVRKNYPGLEDEK